MSPHDASAVEKAYGALWREVGDVGLFVFRARKLLLSAIDADGQRRGIAWALETFGPPDDAEIMESRAVALKCEIDRV